VWDRTQRDVGTLSSSDFEWNEEASEYRCPEAHTLRKQWRPFKNERTHVAQTDTIIYRASQHDRASRAMKQCCCPNTPARRIARSIHESARDVARKIRDTEQYEHSCRERKKVEMLFAHPKRILRLDRLRLRLRGLSGAGAEFTLAGAVQNLRRLAKQIAHGPPLQGIGASARGKTRSNNQQSGPGVEATG
jgi:hypothetical protein